jgi:hypothetical protein
LASIFPVPRLLGLGDWPRALWLRVDSSMQDALLAWVSAGWHVQTWPGRLGAVLPDDGWEALITTLTLLAAGVLASLSMRERAPRVRLLLVLVALTVAIKIGATYLQSAAGLVFNWATPGALAGLAGGTLAMLLALRLPRRWRAALAAAALVLELLLVNVLPVNPYFDVTLADWRQGRYLHFNGLAHWLAWTWPYAALVWLAFSAERAWLRRRHG